MEVEELLSKLVEVEVAADGPRDVVARSIVLLGPPAPAAPSTPSRGEAPRGVIKSDVSVFQRIHEAESDDDGIEEVGRCPDNTGLDPAVRGPLSSWDNSLDDALGALIAGPQSPVPPTPPPTRKRTASTPSTPSSSKYHRSPISTDDVVAVRSSPEGAYPQRRARPVPYATLQVTPPSDALAEARAMAAAIATAPCAAGVRGQIRAATANGAPGKKTPKARTAMTAMKTMSSMKAMRLTTKRTIDANSVAVVAVPATAIPSIPAKPKAAMKVMKAMKAKTAMRRPDPAAVIRASLDAMVQQRASHTQPQDITVTVGKREAAALVEEISMDACAEYPPTVNASARED